MFQLGEAKQALDTFESAAHAFWNEQYGTHAGEYQLAIDTYSKCLGISVDNLNHASGLQERAFWQGKTTQYQMLVDGMEQTKE